MPNRGHLPLARVPRTASFSDVIGEVCGRFSTAAGIGPILLASKIGPMSQSPTYRAWQRLSTKPLGSRLFSAAAMARVPYFASVLPHVVLMEPGRAEVTVPKWFYVKGVET